MKKKRKLSPFTLVLYILLLWWVLHFIPALAAFALPIALLGVGGYTLLRAATNRDDSTPRLAPPMQQRALNEPKPATMREKAEALGEQSKFNQQANEYISRFRRYAQLLQNRSITEPLTKICNTMENILKTSKDEPDKRKMTETFLRSYVPAIQKLLKQYADIEKNHLENSMTDFRLKLEKFMEDASTAFDNHLKSLFQDDILDASAEMSMLQHMLRADGLIGDDPFDDDE